jgi:hypothetical protein
MLVASAGAKQAQLMAAFLAVVVNPPSALAAALLFRSNWLEDRLNIGVLHCQQHLPLRPLWSVRHRRQATQMRDM